MAGELQNGDRRCFVTARVFSSEAITRVVRVKSLPVRWIGLDPCMGQGGFLRSWLQDDDEKQARMTWKAVCGMVLAFGISAAFCAGVGLIFSRVV